MASAESRATGNKRATIALYQEQLLIMCRWPLFTYHACRTKTKRHVGSRIPGLGYPLLCHRATKSELPVTALHHTGSHRAADHVLRAINNHGNI